MFAFTEKKGRLIEFMSAHVMLHMSNIPCQTLENIFGEIIIIIGVDI